MGSQRRVGHVESHVAVAASCVAGGVEGGGDEFVPALRDDVQVGSGGGGARCQRAWRCCAIVGKR